MSRNQPLEAVLSSWLVRHPAKTLLDLRAGRGPLVVPGLTVHAGVTESDSADWVLVDAFDESILHEAAPRALRAVVCVLPNDRCLASTAARRDRGNLRVAAPALWRIGRVRENTLFDRPALASLVALPRVVDDRLSRSRALFVDVTLRPTQAKRRGLVQASS